MKIKSETLNTSYHQARINFANKIYDSEKMLPHRYVFVLTNRCNLRCSFCFQEKDHIEGSLNTDDWIKLVGELPEYAHVTLTGGEPFIFKGFKEVFDKITEKFTCNIISNGVLLNKEIIDHILIKEKFKVLSISVDDIGNKVRDVVPNQWKNAEEMMNYFSTRRHDLNSKAILDSKTVVLDDNADDLFEIHKYCIEKLKCDTHSFMLLKGSPIQYADHMVPLDFMFNSSNAYVYKKFDIILRQLEKVRIYNLSHEKKCFLHPKIIDLNGNKPIHKTNLNFINNGNHNSEDFMPCKAPWESVHINVDGNLFPCMAIKMGNIKESSLKEIIFSESFMKFKNNIKSEGTVPACNRCGYLIPK